MLNIHRILFRRLLISWLVVSAVVGGGVFLYGVERIDDQIVDIAIAESQKFAGQGLPLMRSATGNCTALEMLVEQYAREHFVMIELYDAEHHQLVKKVNPKHAALEKTLSSRGHKFPQDQAYHYERFRHEGQTLLQVLIPLRDSEKNIAGYFEGEFLVDEATMNRLHQELTLTLLAILSAVLLTVIVLYPVVMSLNRDVIRHTRELLLGNIELMEVLGSAIAKRDSDTNVHNYRVSIYAVRLAEAIGLPVDGIRTLIAGAFLHDVGKIGISDAILLKPAKLTEEEFSVMKTHVALGVDILAKSTWLQTARDVVECHHEKFNGTGYGQGLAGDDIPINARIFAIVDVFDALTSKRPYKNPLPFSEAMAIIERDAGTHFDPALVETFAGIAASLHAAISVATDVSVEAELKDIIARYYLPS